MSNLSNVKVKIFRQAEFPNASRLYLEFRIGQKDYCWGSFIDETSPDRMATILTSMIHTIDRAGESA